MTCTVRVSNEGPADVVLRKVAKDGTTLDLPIIVAAGMVSTDINLGPGVMLRVADRADDTLEG